MPRILLLSLSALAVLGALVFLARSGDPASQEAEQLPTAAVLPASGPATAEVPLTLGAGDSPDASRVEGGAVPTPAPLASQAEAIPDGRVLSLTVVDTERRPVSGLALRLTEMERTTLVARTDEEGRLVTAAVWLQGVIEVEHATDAAHPLRWRIAPNLCLIDVGPGEVQQAELTAVEPTAAMTILARDANDSPLEGAVVWTSLSELDGEPDWQRFRRATTDADGLAHIPLYGTEPSTQRAMYGLQSSTEDLVARTLFVEPPLDATFQLTAHAAGEILVRAIDEQGQAVTGVLVVAHPKETYIGIRAGSTLVDALGQARLTPMAPGTYSVNAQYPGQAYYPASKSLELGPAEHAEVTLVVTPGNQPVVAAAGIVLDESGQPLEHAEISIQMGNGRPKSMRTGADGRFLLTGYPGPQSVRVTAEASIFGDAFEPSAVDVPFGTDDLEFRRTAVTELTSSVFELVDAYTGEPIQKDAEAMVFVYREPAPGRRVHADMHYGPDARGICEVEFHRHEDLRYTVEALGYQRQRGVLRQSAPGESPPLHRIELLPGYSRHLVVRARDVGLLAGVRVTDAEGRLLATSDARGELHLDLPESPGTLLFQADGYLPLEWEASNYWFNPVPEVWLAPL